MAKRTRSRPGTTMIETLVALGLLVGLLGLLHALGKAVLKYPATDAQLQAALVFNQALQHEVTEQTRLGVAAGGSSLTLVRATANGTVKFLVEVYPQQGAVHSMIRMTKQEYTGVKLVKSGHEPMLYWAYNLKFEAHNGYVVYHFTMGAQGLRYTGVILGATQSG